MVVKEFILRAKAPVHPAGVLCKWVPGWTRQLMRQMPKILNCKLTTCINKNATEKASFVTRFMPFKQEDHWLSVNPPIW
jgi:hypothetical protein